MSLDKTFVYTELAIGTPDPINLTLITTFYKEERIGANVKDGPYQIIFFRDENQAGVRNLVWKYDNEENRNCDFDQLLALAGQSLTKTN